MQQEEVRALVRANRPTNTAGYPEEVKRAVVAYAQARRAEGTRWEDIGAETGQSSTSLKTWCTQKGRFLPVAITETEPHVPALAQPTSIPAQGLVLHTPSGFRLEGLDPLLARQHKAAATSRSQP